VGTIRDVVNRCPLTHLGNPPAPGGGGEAVDRPRVAALLYRSRTESIQNTERRNLLARNDNTTTEPKTGQPTLQTIADRVGVSRTTVSNAYSRPDQLAPELREKILAVAREIGYAGPNPAARTLRRGQSRTIGVIFTESLTFAFSDPAAVWLLRGISEVCGEHGYTILLLPSPPGERDTAAAVRDAVVDGFIVYCMPTGDPRLHALDDRSLHTVMVDESYRDTAAFVGIDDRAGARQAAEHLLALGHRRFAVITDRIKDDDYVGLASVERQREATFEVNRERLGGYAEAIEAAGLDWADVPVKECFPLSPRTGEREVAELLDRADQPTAIIATSDQLALGVLAAARRRGIDVPGQLSVAGFDDIDEASRSHPGLTTIRQPLLEKGRIAARLYFAEWTDGPPAPVRLPTELIVRASTGPAPIA
jgi:DNA-binding LacI/PurR family transcriptional regulator